MQIDRPSLKEGLPRKPAREEAHRNNAYEDAQCVCRGFFAAIRATIHSIALLLSLRGVYAVEPDLSFTYMEGVTVNDTGFAYDVGHCG